MKSELTAQIRAMSKIKTASVQQRQENERLAMLVAERTRELEQELEWRKRIEEEKSQLEAQFHQAQKMESVGRLAGGVAHDLNNLLSPILGYGEMLLDEFIAGDDRKESVAQIVNAGERARDLVRQLLAFSRKQVLELTPIDLNLVVRGFEKSFAERSGKISTSGLFRRIHSADTGRCQPIGAGHHEPDGQCPGRHARWRRPDR